MKRAAVTAAIAALAWSAGAGAKVDAAAAAKLSKELTPVGAERLGGLAGLPDWTPAARRGGNTGLPSDPALAGQAPIQTITKEDAREYQNRLTEGHMELFSRHTCGWSTRSCARAARTAARCGASISTRTAG